MRKRKRTDHWNIRRVAFVAADSRHSIKLLNVQMPVRVKERTAEETIYEGPIGAAWKRVPATVRDGLDLVGALYADEDQIYRGRISWLQQSVAELVEPGADRLGASPRRRRKGT